MATSKPEKSAAWWYLAKRDKLRLQALREAGLYGGANAAGAGKAPYFYAQSGLNPEAAARAEIKPHPFVQVAVEDFDDSWDMIMGSVLDA